MVWTILLLFLFLAVLALGSTPQPSRENVCVLGGVSTDSSSTGWSRERRRWKGLWHRSAHLAMQTHAVLSSELRAIIFYLSYWISDIDIWLHPFLCHCSCRPRTWSSFQNSVLSANSVRLRFSSDLGMAKARRVPSYIVYIVYIAQYSWAPRLTVPLRASTCWWK